MCQQKSGLLTGKNRQFQNPPHDFTAFFQTPENRLYGIVYILLEIFAPLYLKQEMCPMNEKIILDVDTGTDDAIALCAALLSKDLDVLGI